MTLSEQLHKIDYSSLPISEYNRRYIMRMLPDLDYYLEIYGRCLDMMINRSHKAPRDLCLVDYGGGHGFLSCAAKQRGIGKVIYIDFNSLSAKTASIIGEHLGLSADAIIHGDSEKLREWCTEHQVKPDIIMGMDVIEHIYRLEDFFADMFAINPAVKMLFTTGSTPFNPLVKKRLHKIMVADELGPNGFREERRHHIQHSHRDFTPAQLDYWAQNTRGLNYDDTLEAVANNKPNILADPYNTCDPATGSWTERILPMTDYQAMVKPYGAKAKVANGFYNTHRTGAKGFASRLLNMAIRLTGVKTIAPFIIINIDTQ